MRPLLLTLYHVLLLAPAGRILRLAGRDPLDRAVDRARDSYLIVLADAPVTGRAVTR
ncbi:hypothetical protein ACFFSH_02430 [Streptomyces filamentosus]|uniref:Uncharacterized protein n=1 Tax=Streptomyces filamentosus TaxID=67294 RepID=A0A919BNJ9_STRFL|nr:hypothetical protein [Streptomyces filamentosus]GHG01869.1 hypothetical protein GCM10017667_36870 [Streptomyces filamentosus]